MHTRLNAILRVGLIAYTFVVVLIMVPWTSVPTDDSKLLTLHTAAAVFGVLLCIGLISGQVQLPRRAVFALPIGLLLVVFTVSGLISDHPWNTVPSITRLGALAILYMTAAVAMREVRHVRAWMVSASAAVGLSCLYALSQRFGLPPLPFDLVDQSSALFDDSPGTFGNPNVAGHAIVLAAVFAAYLTVQWRWPAVFLVLYAAYMSGAIQRGAVIALAAAAVAVVLGLMVRRVTARPAAGTYVTIAAGIVAAGLVVAAGVATIAALGGWSIVLDNSTLLRVNAYASAAMMVLARPLLGFGPGNYVIENPAFWTNYEQHWFVQNNLMNQHVHADLLEIATDGGVIAAALFLGIIVLGVGYGLRLGFEQRDTEDRAVRQFGFAAAAFFVAFVVDGFFGFNFYVPVASSLLFIFSGCVDGVVTQDTRVPAGAPRWMGAAVLALVAVIVGAAGILPYLGKVESLDGRRAVAARRYAVADIHFAHAERLQPWSWTVPYRRGAAAQLAGQLQDAQAHFTRTLERNPNYVPAMTYLARLKLSEARNRAASPADAARSLAEAESLAQRALTLAPARADDLDVLGRTYFLSAALGAGGSAEAVQAHWRQSHDLLREAVDRGRAADAEVLTMIAQSAVKIGDTDAAARAYTDAVALLPDSESPYATYFAFAEENGLLDRYAAVIASQLVGAQQRANTALANRWLTRTLAQTAQRADATWTVLRAAVDNRPDDPALWGALADAARAETEQAEYAALVGGLVTRGVRLPLTARVLGMVWSEERGALAGATKALVDAQAAYTKPGVPPEEVKEYRALVDRLESTVLSVPPDTPGLAVAAINVAHIRGAMGEPARAAAVLEARYTTMSIPERMLAASQYAEALLNSGKPDEAERIVQDLIVLDPVKAELRVLLARVLASAGKKQEAWDVYDLLLKIPDLDPALRAMLEGEQSALGL